MEDLLAVADAAGAQRFHVWGYAYGGIVGRYLAARSDRVRSLAYIGVPLGPAATGLYKDAIAGFRARWQPVIAAQEAGKLDRSTISPGDYEALTKGGVKLAVAWQGALLEYPPMEPADFKVPTLWLVATGDTEAMASVKAYEGKLTGTKVTRRACRRPDPFRNAAADRSDDRQAGRVYEEGGIGLLTHQVSGSG